MAKEQVYGSIDIGSNAVRAFIGRVSDKKGYPKVKKLAKKRIPLRIGTEVLKHGRLSKKTVHALVKAMSEFAGFFRENGVTAYSACATESVRLAENGTEVLKLTEDKTGLKTKLISGEEEAGIVYSYNVSNNAPPDKNILFADVGGGSADFVIHNTGQPIQSFSFKIGTLRILTKTVPPGEWDKLARFLKENAKKNMFFGSGGNIRTLRKLSGKKSPQPLTLNELREFYRQMAPLTPEQRMKKWNFPGDRADVIIPAIEIFIFILETTGTEYVYVPKTNLNKGLIANMHQSYQ